MARKPGDRNRDFEKKREQILDILELRVIQEDGHRLSMNEMAQAADVSLSTLRHHLGSREELLKALMERQGSRGQRYLDRVTAEPTTGLEDSLRTTLHQMVIGLEHGLAETLAHGLSVGLRDRTVGPAFLTNLLEPIQQSLEQRLRQHQQRSELINADLRVAALTLLAPVVLAALHQRGLCGNEVRPLSLHALVDEQVTRFVQAYAPAAIAAH
jgi:AcrR family transcriptional regulator